MVGGKDLGLLVGALGATRTSLGWSRQMLVTLVGREDCLVLLEAGVSQKSLKIIDCPTF